MTPEYINARFAEHLETVVTKGTKSLDLFGIKSDRKKEETPESYGNTIVNFYNGVFMLFVHNNKTKRIVPKEIEEEIKVDHHPYTCEIVDTRPESQAILESLLRFPTDVKLLWECVERVYKMMCGISSQLGE